MKTNSCQVCKHNNWSQFSSIPFGYWETKTELLQRKHENYPLSQCQQCGHVQVNVTYTQTLFEELYFRSTQEAVMWHESMIGSSLPYEQMCDFAIGFDKPKTVIDFGCGEGKLLDSVRKRLPNSQLIGVDFNERMPHHQIEYVSLNLNQLGGLSQYDWSGHVDLACASHVLEHLEDPVSFLSRVKDQLSESGQIFIEVPDFSNFHSATSIGLSNLVNLQHIHYYTIDQLTHIASLSGLSVVRSAQFQTGYIPRLQMILKPVTRELMHTQVKRRVLPNTPDVILHYQKFCAKKRNALAFNIIQHVEKYGIVGVWGIGADFYRMLSEHASLVSLINQEKVILFDYALKGKRLEQQIIQCSSKLAHVDFSVYLTPLLAETRIKMKDIAANWPHVIDPFIGKEHSL